MAITRKSLGNNKGELFKKFNEHYTHGEGGLAFEAFRHGWQDAWKERTAKIQQLQTENDKLKSKVVDPR